MQNPQLQKAKGNLLHGEKAPVSGRLRGGEKGNFPGPHPLYGIVLPLPEDGGFSWDDGFCDFTFGSALNDRVGGILRRLKVFGLKKPIKREFELCSYVID